MSFSAQLVSALLECGQRLKDVQERARLCGAPGFAEKGLPLLHGVSQAHPQLLETKGVGADSKSQKEFLKVLAERAGDYLSEVSGLVHSVKDMSQTLLWACQLLVELHNVLGSVTLDSYPDLLHTYMDAFCDVLRAALLLEDVPRKAPGQMVALAAPYVDPAAVAPLLAASQDPLFAAPSVVGHVQRLLRPCTPRIAQVLEVVVGPALSVSGSCESVMAAGLLDPPPCAPGPPSPGPGGRAGPGPGPAPAGAEGGSVAAKAGMFGMTWRQVYAFLRHHAALRQWGLLGIMACPEILRQPGAAQRLCALLSDGFVFPVARDRAACAHELVMNHVVAQGGGAAAGAGAGGRPASGAGAGSSSGGGGGGALSGLLDKGRAAMAIIGGRPRRSNPGGLDPADPLQQLLADAAAAAATVAPAQHRLWRAMLTQQLRTLCAACADTPPARLAAQLEVMLAALSLARDELVWLLRHHHYDAAPGLCTLLAARGLAPSGPVVRATQDDALQALQLLAAMDALHRAMVEIQGPLRKQYKEAAAAEFQAKVVPGTPRVEFRLRQAAAVATHGPAGAAASALSNSTNSLQPFQDLTDLLRSLLSASAPPPDAEARLASARGIWAFLNLQLAAADPPIKAARVLQYAEDTSYLTVLQKSLDASRLLHEAPLLHASACDLAPLGAHVDELLAAVQVVLQGGAGGCRLPDVQAALAAMQALHWLLPNPPAEPPASTNPSRRTTADSAAGLSTRGSTAAPRDADAGRQLPPGVRELPQRCSALVLARVRQLLARVVQAPRYAGSGSDPLLRAATGISFSSSAPDEQGGVGGGAKTKAGGGGGSMLKAWGSKLRLTDAPGQEGSGSSKRKGAMWGLGGARAPRGQQDGEGAGVEGSGVSETEGREALLPPAAELVARLLPLAVALDRGRLLVAEVPPHQQLLMHQRQQGAAPGAWSGLSSLVNRTSSGGGSTGGGSAPEAGGGAVSAALQLCRSQLVEVVRDGFAQLLANTAGAMAQAAVPVPSVQLAAVQHYLEVVSLLQPHLVTELLPELVRLMLQQSAAPTMQSIGMDGAASLRTRGSGGAAPTDGGGKDAPPSRVPSMTGAVSLGGPPDSMAPRPSFHSMTGAGPGPMACRLPSGTMLHPSTRGGAAPAASPAPFHPPVPLGPTVLRAFHTWLWSAVVLDERRRGVVFDPRVGGFTLPAGERGAGGAAEGGMAAATSVRELQLLFELFGPAAAGELARGSEQLVVSCLEALKAHLDTHARPLQDALEAARLPLAARAAAARGALPALSPALEAAAGLVCRLGRCLALRMQLGCAAERAAAGSVGFLTYALQEMAAPTAVGSAARGAAPESLGGGGGSEDGERRVWSALLRLPVGGGGPDAGLPDRDDPLLSAALAGMLHSLGSAQRWHHLPALLAALMAAQPHAAGGQGAPEGQGGGARAAAPKQGSGSGSSRRSGAGGSGSGAGGAAWSAEAEVEATAQCAVRVAVAVALSLQAATAQTLHPAASQFLLGTARPAAATLCAFQRLALAFVQAAAASDAAAAAAGGLGTGRAAARPSKAGAVAAAARQRALAALDALPLLHGYTFVADVTSSSGAEGGMDGAAAWEGGAGGGGDGEEGPGGEGAEGVPGACEPGLEAGRWSGGLDGWRPALRVAPLVMGCVG